MPESVVIDASLALKWLVYEEYTPQANALAQVWNSVGTQMIALPLLPIEVANALHKRVRQGVMSLEAAKLHRNSLMTAGVQLQDATNLHARALELASELRQGAAYDAHYLALAESLGCEMWTADQRFHRVAAGASYPVHWVGDFAAN